MLTPEEIRTWFKRRQAYWSARDAAALASDHSEECVVESPIGGTIQGRSAIEALYGSVFQAFSDMEFRTEDLIIEGSKIAMLWSWRGTHSGNFFGLSSTGKIFQVHGVFVYEVNDTHIVHECRIYDFTGLLVQLGVLKAKPAF